MPPFLDESDKSGAMNDGPYTEAHYRFLDIKFHNGTF